MKTRRVVIFSGATFVVPQSIQRIDTKATHGWQVRYHGTKMFSDHTPDGSGAARSLVKATRELLARIASLPAPVSLRRSPSDGKTSNLPSGISGPIVRLRRGAHVRSASLTVLLPQFGRPAKCTTVYIGTENTYSTERYRLAVAKALVLRETAQARYEAEATAARRKAAWAIRSALRKGASA